MPFSVNNKREMRKVLNALLKPGSFNGSTT
uniref:Uncharacterized protein n=1 Tax=Rhizophora mucronata TaxID=61149 RepID=A0A2P2NAU7_RHIMU